MIQRLFLEPARAEHQEALISLLASVIPDCAVQTVWDVPWRWPDYWIVRSDTAVVGTGALYPIDEHRCELRGLAVDAAFRGQGIARCIVHHLLGVARAKGLDMLCVTRRPDFFESLDFVKTHPFWLDLEPSRRPRGATATDRQAMIAWHRPVPRWSPHSIERSEGSKTESRPDNVIALHALSHHGKSR